MGDLNFEFSKEKRFRLLTIPTALIGLGGGIALTATAATATPALIAAGAVGGLVGGALALPVGLLAIGGIASTTIKTGAAFFKSLSPRKIKQRRRRNPNSIVAKYALLQIPAATWKVFSAEAKLWSAGIVIAGFEALKTLIPSLPKKKQSEGPDAKAKKTTPKSTKPIAKPTTSASASPDLSKSFNVDKPANDDQKKQAQQTPKPKAPAVKK